MKIAQAARGFLHVGLKMKNGVAVAAEALTRQTLQLAKQERTRLFLRAGQRMSLVPVLFVVTILAAGLLGAVVSSVYSEPLNRLLRRGWASGRKSVS